MLKEPPYKLAPFTLPNSSTEKSELSNTSPLCILGATNTVFPFIIPSTFTLPVNLASLATRLPEFDTLKFLPIVILPFDMLQLPSWSTVKALYSSPFSSVPIPICPPYIFAPVTSPSLLTVKVELSFLIVPPINSAPCIFPPEVMEPINSASLAYSLPLVSTWKLPPDVMSSVPSRIAPLTLPLISASLAVNIPSAVSLKLGSISFPFSSYNSLEYILAAIIVPPLRVPPSITDPSIVPFIYASSAYKEPSGVNRNLGSSL